jgi:nicotinamide mononucleotide adenylyltransferase
MFEQARDDARTKGYAVLGGILSPVNDKYTKLGLASAYHRVNMCEIAVEETSDWLMVDDWEARQEGYTPTAQVLDHFDYELNVVRGGVDCVVEDAETGRTWVEKRRVKIMLLAGSDLIQTMSEPGVWSEDDVSPIFYLAEGAGY